MLIAFMLMLCTCTRRTSLDKATIRLLKAVNGSDCPSNAKELLATVRGSGGVHAGIRAYPAEIESWHPAYTYSLLVQGYYGYDGPPLVQIVENYLGDSQVHKGISRFWRTQCGTIEATPGHPEHQTLTFFRGDLLNIVEDPRLPRLDLDRVAANFWTPPPDGYDFTRETRYKDEPFFYGGVHTVPKHIAPGARRDPLMCVRTSVPINRISPKLISAALTPLVSTPSRS